MDANGNLQTTYSYDPFGTTTTSGQNSGNEFQYTGRENDGNGLYYYRARYYNPQFGRFISEDPLRFSAGANFYSYVSDAPTNFVDPRGTDKHSWLDCTLAGAKSASLADMFGIQNRFGQAMLGNTLADLGETVRDLGRGDLLGAVDNGTNVAIDKGVEGAAEHLASMAPGSTTVAFNLTIYTTEDGFGMGGSLLIHTEESALPALLGDINLVKTAWDVSGLVAAGGV